MPTTAVDIIAFGFQVAAAVLAALQARFERRAFPWGIIALLVFAFPLRPVSSRAAVFLTDNLRVEIFPEALLLLFAMLLFTAVLFTVKHVHDIRVVARVRAAVLRRSEETYRAIFNAANDAIFVHDMETGALLDVNRRMTELYGYSAEEARRLTVGDISDGSPPYSQEDALRLIHKAVEGEPQLFEWRSKDKAGERFWVEVNLKRATIGGAERILAVVRDITDRKRAEEALRRSETTIRALFEAIPDLIFLIGRDGVFRSYKAANEEDLAVSASEIVGRHVREILPSAIAEKSVSGIQRALETGNVQIYEYRLATRAGEDRDWEARVVPCGADAALCIVRDITDRKRAEEQLKHYSENLERMVELRTKELDRARARLFHSSKLAALGRMGAGVAHQLNSPICGGLLFVDTLIEDFENSKRQADILKNLRKTLLGMRDSIEVMLTMAMVQRRGKAPWGAVDLNEVMGRILELVSLECRRHHIDVERCLDAQLPTIEGRSGELDQVFINIINNAIDAMPDGGTLTVESAAEDGTIIVTVRDSGKGIAPETCEQIFEPFFTTRMAERGIGLGLSIAREVVDGYGGEIEVESAVGRGCAFTVRLPRKTQRPPEGTS